MSFSEFKIIAQNPLPHRVFDGKGNLSFSFFESGKITPLDSVNVIIFKGDTLLVTVNSENKTELSFHIQPAIYNIQVKKDGYLDKKYDQFTVRELATGYFRVNLIKNKSDKSSR